MSPFSPTATPQLPTGETNGPTTITQTTSDTAPPLAATPGTKGKAFLANKPLSGFVFGLAGLVGLILVFIIITSFVRRRNRKRLLADASNFSFDPRDVEDGTSDEKYSHSGHVGQYNLGRGPNDYPLDNRVVGVAGVGAGGISRPAPAHSPPMPNYIPQDYGGHESSHLNQYHNLGNVPVGYNPTPNPYDMYGPRNGGGYPNGRVQHDPFSISGPNGESFSASDPGYPVPRQLQPGIRSAQGPTFAPHLSNNSPQLLNHSPPTTSPPPPSYTQPSASDHGDPIRLPTPGFPSDTSGQRDSCDGADDAYGGAFLGPDSHPEQRTLQVSWPRSTVVIHCH